MPLPASIRSFLILTTILLCLCHKGICSEPPLVKIAEVQLHTVKNSLQRSTVKIRGVITWCWGRANTDAYCIQDESGGIWMNVRMARENQIWHGSANTLLDLDEGSEIEIEGVIRMNESPPVILPVDIRKLGTKAIPLAVPEASGNVMKGFSMLQRVELSGIVHSCVPIDKGFRLRVETSIGSYFLAQVQGGDHIIPALFEDARVTVTGVATPVLNARGKFVRPMLLVSREEDIVKLDLPPIDPFSVPSIKLADLVSYSQSPQALHRCKIQGTVTYWEPGSLLYIQDDECAVRVWSDSNENLNPGDIVEAAGFVETTGPVGELHRAILRKTSSGQSPQPLTTLLASLPGHATEASNNAHSPPDYDGLLVTVSGRLLRIHKDAIHGMPRLLLDSGQAFTTVCLRGNSRRRDADKLTALRIGSTLTATGIAMLQRNIPEPPGDTTSPMRMDLLLRDINDVTVLEAPSWWTPRRLGIALAGTGAALSAFLIWTFSLQRLVRQRSKRLEEVMGKHRDIELEYKAAQQERQRLAADMHDGIQQLIAGASFRLQAAEVHLQEIPISAQTQLSAARDALVRAQTSLRNFISGSVLTEDTLSDFAALIHHSARKMDHWPLDAVAVVTLGDPFPLSRHVMGSLLLLIHEAAGNAFKHGNAKHVRVRIIYKDETLEIRIEDDGSGFDTQKLPKDGQGHFGLESMRHRMRWLGGTVDVQSTKGEGTCVRIRLQKSRSQATRRLRSAS